MPRDEEDPVGRCDLVRRDLGAPARATVVLFAVALVEILEQLLDERSRDRIGEYVDAGAEQINIAMRAPFDGDALERFAKAVGIA